VPSSNVSFTFVCCVLLFAAAKLYADVLLPSLSCIVVMFALTEVTCMLSVVLMLWKVAVTVDVPAATPRSCVDDVVSALVSLDWYVLCDDTVCVVLSERVATTLAVARWK
jgi:hypothetical protein